MPTLNLNTAWTLDLTGIYEGNSFEVVLNRFEDEAQTIPEDWPVGTYTFAVSAKTNGGTAPLMMLTTTSGQLVIVDSVLTITCLESENLMTVDSSKASKTYYYDLTVDLGAGITRVEGKGTITVNPSVGR